MNSGLISAGSIVYAVVMLAGCGATTGSVAPAASASSSNMAGGPAGTFKPSGLILVSCSQTRLTVSSMSPADGKILSSESIDFSKLHGVGCPAGTLLGGISVLQDRERFDTEYTRVTAVVAEPDGSHHVGFYDLRTGAFTDLTLKRISQNSFSALPQESGALFHPTTDTFWYEAADSNQNIRAFVMDLRTGRSVDKEVLASGEAAVLAGPDFGFSLPKGSEKAVSADLGLPNPSGTHVKESSNCDPDVWVDDYRLICKSMELLQYAPDYGSTTTIDILPATDRLNYNPVGSPDGTQMAFLSARSGQTAIYRVALTAGASPTKVADLPADGALLEEWR